MKTKQSHRLRAAALPLVLSCGVALSACANLNPEQQGTAKGAGIGVATGAVLGGVLGGRDGAATGAVLGGLAGAVGGNFWSKRMEDKQRAMEQATQGTGVQVARTPDNELKLDVPSDISFSTGSAALQPALRPVLDKFAQGLNTDPGLQVRVVGHTDSTGSQAVNDQLSLERAGSVRNYLEDRGISGSRIKVTGRGENEPVATNDTAAGRAANRRVEIYLRDIAAAS